MAFFSTFRPIVCYPQFQKQQQQQQYLGFSFCFIFRRQELMTWRDGCVTSWPASGGGVHRVFWIADPRRVVSVQMFIPSRVLFSKYFYISVEFFSLSPFRFERLNSRWAREEDHLWVFCVVLSCCCCRPWCVNYRCQRGVLMATWDNSRVAGPALGRGAGRFHLILFWLKT